MSGIPGEERDFYKESNALLSDVILNYRTVISFGEKNIDFLMSKFINLLDQPKRKNIRSSHVQGIIFGYSKAACDFYTAIVYYLGAMIVFKNGGVSEGIYIAIYVLFNAAIGSGYAISRAPSLPKAR